MCYSSDFKGKGTGADSDLAGLCDKADIIYQVTRETPREPAPPYLAESSDKCTGERLLRSNVQKGTKGSEINTDASCQVG